MGPKLIFQTVELKKAYQAYITRCISNHDTALNHNVSFDKFVSFENYDTFFVT